MVTAIETIEQLEAIYGQPGDAATIKVAYRITPSYRALIESSP
ncbi:pyridoxamine 5'-phosphate oxidase-related, FMN-binding protein [Nitrobacter sp. TKz-YC01]|mgnify:FL=1